MITQKAFLLLLLFTQLVFISTLERRPVTSRSSRNNEEPDIDNEDNDNDNDFPNTPDNSDEIPSTPSFKWCWYPCYCWYDIESPFMGTYPKCWCWYPCGCWENNPQDNINFEASGAHPLSTRSTRRSAPTSSTTPPPPSGSPPSTPP
jgi:hypothetical protein